MADMGINDITYVTAPAGPQIRLPGRVTRNVNLAFPNNAANLTYPTGGIPLNKAALGCPRSLQSLVVQASTPAAGDLNPVWRWNGSDSAPALVAYETATVVDLPFKQVTAAHSFTLASQILSVTVEGY